MLVETNDPRLVRQLQMERLRDTRWADIKTQFVRDRMTETTWENHGHVMALMTIEMFVLRGGPKSYVEAMHYHDLRGRYPIEAECIARELKEGVYTSPVEYRRMLRAKREEERLARLREEERKKKELEEEEQMRQEWIRAGGRP